MDHGTLEIDAHCHTSLEARVELGLLGIVPTEALKLKTQVGRQ